MLKGVSRRIIEIKPKSEYFERAVLYLRSGADCPRSGKAVKIAEECLEDELSESPKEPSGRNLRVTVAVLSICLGLTLTAFAALLILYTKI